MPAPHATPSPSQRPDRGPDVALIATGGRGWMAGTLHQHSLLHGNALLPASERARFHLVLNRVRQDPGDYQAVTHLLAGRSEVEFFPGPRLNLLRRLRQGVSTHLRRGELRLPRDTFEAELGATAAEWVYPANEVIQPRSRRRQIGWFADFQHLHLPGLFAARERRERRRHFERVIALADVVVVHNQHSLRDALALAPEHRDKLRVFPFTMMLPADLGGDLPRAVAARHALPERFLMLPAQFWKHKDHRTAFEALHILRRMGHEITLVCTGATFDHRFPDHFASLEDLLRARGLTGQVRILGFLPRVEQVALMRRAAAIVQPSLFEGFSALLEDCRSLGKIVFASDTEMHREQESDDTAYFRAGDPESLAAHIAERWHSLGPGPALDKEAPALAAHEVRLRDFARAFVSQCAPTWRTHDRSPQ